MANTNKSDSVYNPLNAPTMGQEPRKRRNLALRAYIRMMKKARELQEERRADPERSKYHEHHSFPKAIFTNKETANNKKRLLLLTHGEHFQAHHMLYNALKARYGEHDKRTIDMGHAIGRMVGSEGNTKLTKKQYEAAMKVRSEVMKAQYADPQARKIHGEKVREGWKNNPDARKKMGEGVRKAQLERYKNPEEIEKAREQRLRLLKERPDFNKKVGEKVREAYKKPEHRANKAKAMKIARNTPEAKAKVSAQFKGAKFYHKVLEDGTIVRTRTNKDPGEGWTLGQNPKKG